MSKEIKFNYEEELAILHTELVHLQEWVKKQSKTTQCSQCQAAYKLKKESIDLIDLAERLVSKHQILTHKKELSFSTNLQPCYANVDVFHFENVILPGLHIQIKPTVMQIIAIAIITSFTHQIV